MRELINLFKSILFSNFRRLNKPYKLTFALTYQCNSRCKICQIWKRKKHKELSFEEIKKFFTINKFFNWVDLTGGEVFLRKDLIQIIKVIFDTQKNLYLLHIPTNGILTRKIASEVKKILSFKPHRFLISIALDGPSEIHDQLRGAKEGWRRAVNTYEKLKKLKSNNFDCFFGMTLSKFNFRLIEETYQVLKKEINDLDRNDIHFNIAHKSLHYYQNPNVDLGLGGEIGEELKKFNQKKKFVFSGVYFLERVYQKLIPCYLKTKKTPIPCQALSASIFIDPLGNIYPCGMWDKKLGSLKDYNFNLKKLWQEKKIKKIVGLIKNKKCPNCWTPCEAYQSILGSLLQSSRYMLS